MHLEPAKSVIEKLGGPAAVAEVTGKHITRVYRWMYPKSRGGTGGCVPHDDARKIIDHAKANGLPLGPEDFFPAPTSQSEVA